MDSREVDERLDQIPVLHCRGTHKRVGFIIGRQFKSMISDLVDKWTFFQRILLPTYETVNGRRIYEETLGHCTRRYPQYVQELEGMATGSGQPFHKLFLLHLDSTLAPPDAEDDLWKDKTNTGCTTLILSNPNSQQVVLAHTEDTGPEFLNNVYIVTAEILGEDGEVVEKFTTLTYAGHLPGYTMGFNSGGLIYSINTLYPKKIHHPGTPRTFLTRAILGVSTLEDALRILRDEGGGCSDGFSINLAFGKAEEGKPLLHNIEVAPPNQKLGIQESQLSVLTIPPGEFYAHCNKFLRLPIPEFGGLGQDSSIQRHKTIVRFPKPTSIDKVKDILSDVRDEFPIFRTGGEPKNIVTVAVGIFDIVRRTWSIYINPPASSTPILIIPMEFN